MIPLIDVILRMLPDRCRSMTPMTGLVRLNTPFKFVFRTSSQSFSLIRAMSLSRVMPALLTRMSILPNRSFTCFELFSLIEARHIDWKSDNRVVVRNLIGSGFILQVSEHHSGSRARERLH